MVTSNLDVSFLYGTEQLHSIIFINTYYSTDTIFYVQCKGDKNYGESFLSLNVT